MHTPGLKVVLPSTPYDAKGLLKSAIRDDNPVIFLEHKLLYGGRSPGGKARSAVGEVASSMKAAPKEEYLIPLGSADVKRVGSDLTVVATLFMVHRMLLLAERFAGEGLELEVIDPRTLVPLDIDTIVESVKKTGRLLVVSEDVECGGVAAEIIARVEECAFDYLDAPALRVSSLNTPVPFAPNCEAYVLPSERRIEEAVRKIL